MKKCTKVKNPCKICLQAVTHKTGLQCQGACKRWMHFNCLNYTPGKIRDIKQGAIKVNCPCPDCKNAEQPKELQINMPFSCTNMQCPANNPPKCEKLDCPANDPLNKPPPGAKPIPPPPMGQPNEFQARGCCGNAQQGIQTSVLMPPMQTHSSDCPLNKCTQKGCQSNVMLTQNIDPDSRRDCLQINAPPSTPKPVMQVPSSNFQGIRLKSGTNGGPQGHKSDPSFDAVEQMCNTVGQLTCQINELMKKMRDAVKDKDNLQQCPGGEQQKTLSTRPCHCPGNPCKGLNILKKQC